MRAPRVRIPLWLGILTSTPCPVHRRKETIAKMVDAMDLVDLSRHIYQFLGTWLRGRWRWQMRREGRFLIKDSQPLPQCMQYGLQMPVKDLNQGHHRTGLCQRGWERKCQHAVAVRSQQALEHTFTAYGEELERGEVFKYLGWLIACNDPDNQAMWSNPRKARGCWAWVSHVLWAENASPQMCGIFIWQPCRLYYCTEVRHGVWPRQLEGFHIRAAW
jgi:hypothetical protein